jgi:large subunit ribosomal protein L15
MQSHELRPPKGELHKQRKRVGRGDSAGQGSYSGKGMKGQKARSGHDIRIGFEGGQLPLIRRMSRKRGFTNHFRTEYEIVNVARLEKLEGDAEVTPQSLRVAGIVKKEQLPVKILGEGELTKALTVKANRFTASAKAKIEAAGGRWEELGDAGSGG